MKKAIISLIFVLGFVIISKAQSSLNDYKYVIVEEQFHFQNEANEYNLNELTKFLFNKHGFISVLYGDTYPDDLKSNYCLALTSKITAKGTFKTKITIVLRDCNNNIVFQAEGATKEKQFKKVYDIGIRKAFEHFNNLNYKYIPNTDIITKIDTFNNETKRLKSELESLKTEQDKTVIKVEEIKKIEEIVEKDKDIVEETIEYVKEIIKKQSNILYAQKIDNGFQIVDSTPKVVLVLFSTPKQDIFIVKSRDAIVYKEDGIWYLSENKGTTTITKTLNIKF